MLIHKKYKLVNKVEQESRFSNGRICSHEQQKKQKFSDVIGS